MQNLARPSLLEVNAGPSFAIDNVVPVDPREVRKGHYAPSKPANSRFMDASPVLHECASLDLVPDVCYCRDGGGGGAAHVHELSAVDAHVKSSALAGALEIVRRAQRGGLSRTGSGATTSEGSGGHGGASFDMALEDLHVIDVVGRGGSEMVTFLRLSGIAANPAGSSPPPFSTRGVALPVGISIWRLRRENAWLRLRWITPPGRGGSRSRG